MTERCVDQEGTVTHLPLSPACPSRKSLDDQRWTAAWQGGGRKRKEVSAGFTPSARVPQDISETKWKRQDAEEKEKGIYYLLRAPEAGPA